MPRTAVELCRLSATELSNLLEKRDVSPLEIVDALLQRIDEVDDKINAFICVDNKLARSEARAAEREMRSTARKSRLHGIPIAHKDVFDARGYATTAGSRVTSWQDVDRDSAVVGRLRDAGAIVLGKTNTTEYAAGTMEVFGETHNPWDLRMTTGTSSAGSAAAVAACMAPLATGSDTGGSIRIPAAYCGVVGFKPTFDVALQNGMAPFSRSFDTPGPMARCVKDVALFMGLDGGAFDTVLDGIRIGVSRKYFFEGLDAEVERAVEDALHVLQRLGVLLVDVDLPHIAETGGAFWVIAYTDALESYRRDVMTRHDDFTKPLLHRLLAAACLTEEEIRRAINVRNQISDELGEALETVDAIVTPTAPAPATPIGAKLVHLDRNRFTRPANLAGIPALSITCGFSRAGLPVGMQLMGRKNGESTLLRVAWAYEESTNWNRHIPPVAIPVGGAPDVIPSVGAPHVIPSVGAQAPKSRDSDNAAILAFLHKQGFDFANEEMASAAAAALEPIRSNS